jgi:hypothetical protein
MNRQSVNVEQMGTADIIVGCSRRKIASSTKFYSVTNKNRPKSQRGSICHSSGQGRDLIDDGQISGKDLTKLKTIAADIGSETPFDYLPIPKRNIEWEVTGNDFDDVVGFGESPFDDHSSRISRQ